MSLKRAGFFRELRHGGDEVSLSDAQRSSADPRKDGVLHYLRNGSWLAASPSPVGDALDPSSDVVIPLGILTDGVWEWPSDLAHYVERYNVELPAAFVAHMQERRWQPPELSEDDLIALEPEVVSRTAGE